MEKDINKDINKDIDNNINEDMTSQVVSESEEGSGDFFQLPELSEDEIPESLRPENVVVSLKDDANNRKKAKRQKRIKKASKVMGTMAACFVLAIGGFNIYKVIHTRDLEEKRFDVEEEVIQASVAKVDRKDSLGQCFKLANSYQDIDASIADSCRYYNRKESWFSFENLAETASISDMKSESAEDMAGASSSANSGMAEGDSDFSSTNLQTEGVDESDVVLTDGSYIYYIIGGKRVAIVDAINGYVTLSNINRRENIYDEAGDSLLEEYREMYVDGDRLYLVAQVDTMAYEAIDDGDILYGTETMDCYCMCFNPVKASQTILYTYDISDRSNPNLIGSLYQDGSYNTSRKVGEYIYLFSQFSIGLVSEDYDYTSFIPTVNGKYLEADSIYIGSNAYSEQIMSSIHVNNPDQVYDSIAVAGNLNEVYMGNSAIYLYGWYYREENDGFTQSVCFEGTEIAKFSYQDGIMNGVANTQIEGDITDTFAINEYQDELRVLTSYGYYQSNGEDGNWIMTNTLYCLDANLQVLGTIPHIADGESVYAARFFGEKAYFVTYLNHDPIFVADLSDPSNPKLFGNIEISGYSDYLHMFGENQVLGIGYETDEESSDFKGYKLCMFDFSDTLNPRTLSANVYQMEDGWGYIPGLYAYKDLLVDPGKNLIGYQTESYMNTENYSSLVYQYFLYRWNGSEFEQLILASHSDEEMRQELGLEEFDYYNAQVRGIYLGSDFVILWNDTLEIYDMDNHFELKNSVRI